MGPPATRRPEMIQTSLSQLIVVYLSSVIGLLALLWFVREWRRRRIERLARRHRFLCRICGEGFEDAGDGELAKCPVCGSLNERMPLREI